MPNSLHRLRSAVRDEGASGVARRVATRGAHRVVLREAHIWYSLDLAGDRPRRPLPDGFELNRATEQDADAVASLPNQPAADEIRARIAGPADVYLVSEAGTPAFACTIFRERTPTVAARGGWVDLPEATVCLEDSGTSPDFRGRGVAPAAWSAIADDLAERGVTTMLTKVAVDNEPSRRAVVKAGFGEAADMHMRRIGPFRRVALSPLGAPGAEFLTALLGG
jgi:ribosomal protein S18 acetylase RimI-like enzyme